MKVLIVEPGKYPREADIEHTLEAEQAVVGGTIEAVYPWRDSACIVCNDKRHCRKPAAEPYAGRL